MEQGNEMMADSQWEIYGLRRINTDEIRYVGQTKRGSAIRFKEHLYRKTLHSSPLQRWISKYGIDSIEFVIIQDNIFSLAEANLAEQYWVSFYNSKNVKLLNLTEGGGGTTGTKLTSEQKKKLSDRRGINHHNYGKHWSESTRKKMSESHKGKVSPNKGKSPSTETRRKISESMPDRSGKNNPMYGTKMSQEHKDRLKEINSRPRTDEEKLKSSMTQKGKPNRGGHVRFHVNRRKYISSCIFCVSEGLQS